MPNFERSFRFKNTLSFGATDQVKSVVLPFTGVIQQIHVRLPDFATAANGVLTLEDSDGYVLYTSSAMNKNTNNNVDTTQYVPANDKMILKLTLNAAAGTGGGDVVVAIRYKGEA